jgi:hypothetical protein
LPQREEYIRNVFEIMRIKAQFIPAILRAELPPLQELLDNGIMGDIYLRKHLPNENYPNMDLRAFEANPKNTKYVNSKLKGVLALQLSYMQIFEQFLQTGHSHCFIFEDDILLQTPRQRKHTIHRLQEIFKELPSDYNLLNLGRCLDDCKNNKNFSKNLVVNTTPVCTHACGYSVQMAKYVLQNALPLQVQCDILLKKQYINNGFSARPALFFQNHTIESSLMNYPTPECKPNAPKESKESKASKESNAPKSKKK